jgi:hypothetical protein
MSETPATDLVIRLQDYIDNVDDIPLRLEAAKEIVQLRKDVAIMRDNSTRMIELEAERADLAETLRVVRNTQGGRFGIDWPSIERMINEALSPARPDVPARHMTEAERSAMNRAAGASATVVDAGFEDTRTKEHG